MSTATIEPEVLEPQTEALDLRQPEVPVTLNELAARVGEGLEIIRARAEILATVRKASIRATSPEDWLLFRDKTSGLVVGYLQDCGCDRVVGLWGIEIFRIGQPEKIIAPDLSFMYLIRGSGRCALTGQEVHDVEGGRDSHDDFCQDKKGAGLELAVRKSARANLDGNIVRELAGLKSVPEKELKAAGLDTSKCRLGRGFGSRVERQGADLQEAPGVRQSEAPKCPKCDGEMRFIPAGKTKAGKPYDAFWGCKKPREKCNGTRVASEEAPGQTKGPADFKTTLINLAIDAGITPTHLDEWIAERSSNGVLNRDGFELIKADLENLIGERQAMEER